MARDEKVHLLKKPSVNVIDGAYSPKDISEVFVSKYETLLQSKPTDVNELQSIYRNIGFQGSCR